MTSRMISFVGIYRPGPGTGTGGGAGSRGKPGGVGGVGGCHHLQPPTMVLPYAIITTIRNIRTIFIAHPFLCLACNSPASFSLYFQPIA
jgi:hypothetical protein